MIDILRGRITQLMLLFLTILLLNPSPESRSFISHVEKAKIAAEAGEKSAVYEHLTAARKHNPYSPSLQLSLARAALDLGYNVEAKDLLFGYETFLATTEEVECMKAEVMITSMEITEVYLAWDAIPSHCAGNPLFLTDLAEELLQAKEIESALHVLEFQTSLSDSDRDTNLRFGMLSSLVEPDESLSRLRPFARESPLARDLVEAIENYRPLQQRELSLAAVGQVFGRHSEWFLASLAFENAIIANPQYSTAYSFLGLSVDALDENGLSYLEKAVELNPEDALPHLNLALHWLQSGVANLAIFELEIAARLDPSNPFIAAQMGQAYDLLGDFEAALSAYKHATGLAPQDPGIWLLLADASLRYQVDLENIALPAARNAVALDPEDANALDALGYTYFLLEDIDFAERFIKQSIALDSTLANAHYHMGLLHLHQENLELAKESFELANQFDPEGEIGNLARRALERLG